MVSNITVDIQEHIVFYLFDSFRNKIIMCIVRMFVFLRALN